MSKPEKAVTRPRPLFYPQWPEQDRRDHAHKLLPFVGESNMPEWVKRDIERLLIDLALGSRPRGGKPRTPHQTQRRIALCLAWLKERHGDLKQKQRDAIVVEMLQVKARALTTIPGAHTDLAAKSITQWSTTPEGQMFTAHLDTEATRERAKLKRLRR